MTDPATRIPSWSPRQPARIDLPVLPPDDERAAVAMILAAIETEHIDPRDVYRELRPVLARLGKNVLPDRSVNDLQTIEHAAMVRACARELERAEARERWARCRKHRHNGTLSSVQVHILMRVAWREFHGFTSR